MWTLCETPFATTHFDLISLTLALKDGRHFLSTFITIDLCTVPLVIATRFQAYPHNTCQTRKLFINIFANSQNSTSTLVKVVVIWIILGWKDLKVMSEIFTILPFSHKKIERKCVSMYYYGALTYLRHYLKATSASLSPYQTYSLFNMEDERIYARWANA